VKNAHITSRKAYDEMYKESLENPDAFWGRIAGEFEWNKKYSSVKGNEDFTNGEVKWFEGGKLNITVNCLDRHLATRGDKVALIWEGNEPGMQKTFSYRELYHHVCKFSNYLLQLGVKKGDRVCLYLPMVPEYVFFMLACVRIGAVHNIIFGGFSGQSIRQRIEDCEASFVITANEGYRGSKTIPLKDTIDEALSEGCPSVKQVIVMRRTQADVAMKSNRDIWFDESSLENCADEHVAEIMNSEDPLFILYTSGSTGKPKGVMHTVAGYMVYVATTLKYAFDLKEDDIFWCTADIGWVTGHSYIVYGPLLNGGTSIMFEGLLTYPDAGRAWEIVERNKVNIFYTAPTLIRVLVREGESFPKKYDLSSLRLLGSVGEPINPDPWKWYYDVIGGGHCPIIDTYWQTETGGYIICPFPAAYPMKPGCAGRPFFGIDPVILDDSGKEINEVGRGGHLCVRHSWPGMMRGVYHHPELFKEKYFSNFPGYYETGDGAYRDADGDIWILGRIDDVLSVAGHRLGTSEIESALVSHPDVTEAAVIGIPDELKGQSICAYIVLHAGKQVDDVLLKELSQHVGDEVGAIARPSVIHVVQALPKTRSGKIMRRILKKIAVGEMNDLGDVSALADPDVLDELLKNR
jgi:acetyl-CoA synthetase